MSNYDKKYLKYKNKYIDLKIDYEKYGGCKENKLIIFYDNTNVLVNDVFNKMKEGYNSTKESRGIADKYYIENKNININMDLNLLLNIFRYDLNDNKVKPLFICDLPNLYTSNRYTYLRKPFEKAKKMYLEKSTLTFPNIPKTNSSEVSLIINSTSDNASTKQFAERIKEFINQNDNINNGQRKQALKSLLQIIKCYQDLTTADIYLSQISRIGGYSYIDCKITPPSGINSDTINIQFLDIQQSNTDSDENNEQENDKRNKNIEYYISEQKKKNDKEALQAYVKNNQILLDNLNLKFDYDNIQFNTINDMIYLIVTNVKSTIKIGVIDTYPNAET